MSTNHTRFPYNPYDYVTNTTRRSELRNRAEWLTLDQSNLLGTIKISEFGGILYKISENSYYGVDTDEKAFSWCCIVEFLQRTKLTVSNEGLVEANIDRWMTGSSWGHILVSFTDGRHGTAGGPNSYTDGTFADAEREVDAYERTIAGFNLRFIRNDGDMTASLNTVRTMFAFRNGGFAGFAREWNRVFLGRN
jgi:hypothetical protein